MNFTLNQLRDFAFLFSRREAYRWFKNDFEAIDLKIKRYNLSKKNKGNNYLSILKDTYKILEQNYQNEYIIKNEFINNWVKNEIQDKNALAFNELRIGKAIVDLAVFNGSSKAFEIKTILDKEYRLNGQINEYKKIFNEVYIIIPQSQLSKYLDFDKDVGVISYNLSSKLFLLERKPTTNINIDIETIMEVLHTKEYLKICKDFYGDIPSMNASNQFNISKKLISQIPNKDLNKLFIDTIKKRKVNNDFFNKINNEFNQICLSLNLNKIDRDIMIDKLKSNTY